MNEDTALGYVLGTLDDEEMQRAEARVHEDAAFARSVEHARNDVGDITHGMELLARRSSPSARTHHSSRVRQLIGVAAALTALVVLVVALKNPNQVARNDPGQGNPVPPGQAMQVPGAGDLDNLTRDAVGIVVGVIEEMRFGVTGGADYGLAKVRVSETIAGTPQDTVFALDYIYGITPDAEQGAWAATGDEVLLFLASSADTVHETIEPEHFQVLNGQAGRYFIRDGALLDASFTLDEVRASVA